MTIGQKSLLIIFFLVIGTFSLYEVIDELSDIINGEDTFESYGEILMIVVSFSGFLYLLFMTHQQRTQQAETDLQLTKVRQQLEGSNIRLQQGKKDYQKVIEWQFGEWHLTPSEKEVALALLKGLSIKEIAAQRTTQEKTVRKQASSIYEKSNLCGRHEFAAWFFEDLL